MSLQKRKGEKTFTEIYERYAGLVLKSVMAQTCDIELAAEICQQTFVNFYQHMDTVDLDFAKAWLLHVAKNLLIDYWRKASTRKEILEVEAFGNYVRGPAAADMEKQSTDKIFLCNVLEDLKQENELWYEVIEHICILEESYEEAAKQLGITPAVLRARLYRARRYIQNKYGSDYF